MGYITKKGKHNLDYSEQLRKERQPEITFNPKTRKYEVTGELKKKFEEIREKHQAFLEAKKTNKNINRKTFFIDDTH